MKTFNKNQSFYADVQLISTKMENVPLWTEHQVLFLDLPQTGGRLMFYINDQSNKRYYLDGSTIVSVLVFDNFIKVQTKTNTYIISNLTN